MEIKLSLNGLNQFTIDINENEHHSISSGNFKCKTLSNLKFNEWAIYKTNLKIELKKAIKLNELGFNSWESNHSGSTDFPLANVGLFTDGDSHDYSQIWLVFVPISNPLGVGFIGKQYLNIAHFEHAYIEKDKQAAPVVFATCIAKKDKENSAIEPIINPKWTALIHWWPLGKPNVDHSGLGIEPILIETWTGAVKRSLNGNRMLNAGNPWVCFPAVNYTDKHYTPGGSNETYLINQSPILVADIDLIDNKYEIKLRSFFIYGYDRLKSAANIDFNWQVSQTTDPVTGKPKDKYRSDLNGLKLTGLLNSHFDAMISNADPTDGEGWGEKWYTNSFDQKVVSNRLISFSITNHLNQTLENNSGEFEASIYFDKLSISSPASITLGSMDMLLSSSDQTKIKLTIRGTWNSEICDIYPEIDLTDLGCTYQYSAGTDLASQDLNATFDTINAEEDQLHRDGGIVIQQNPNPKNSGTLSIRAKCEPGRNSIVEWSISGKTKDNEATKAKALYFQAKPFAVARLWEPDHDAAGGEAIAFWSSNDPEGAQWRVADATMTLELPPQAVGEEMERGKRFWPTTMVDLDLELVGPQSSYINQTKPVRYRFSPPTLLEVKPSIKDRRYNPVPNNLQMVFKEAVVTQFVTEIVYPIRTQFKVNDEGLPHIRIAETSSFLGKPAVNLPVYITDPKADANEILRFDKTILADEIAEYKKFKYSEFNDFRQQYTQLRSRHSAVKANFVSRLAQYHLYNPYRQDGKLNLKDGLSFRIRSQGEGAPPLISPLPTGVELLESYLVELSNDKFISNNQFSKGETDGALRAGVIHTIEFASELMAVLKRPTSTTGLIESLSFTALGANGHISVSFDEGRTTFVADVYHGQIGRLQKIRIGRLGVLWNKVRHVIVYERTTVPSQQFKDEQNSPEFLGWPIIRKTAEYIEPIEFNRKFDTESGKELNATGFVEACEIISPRIYVNSAWGKDYEHGYEIPLWNRNDSTGFYPKPSIAIKTHAGVEEITKQMLDEPEHVYFYTNTQTNTGSDTDKWQPQVKIDCPIGLARLPVITGQQLIKGKPQDILNRQSMPEPSLNVARRPRFDFAVVSNGLVNLQHKRGETAMLAPMKMVSLARTNESSSASSEAIEGISKLVENREKINQFKLDLETQIGEIKKLIPQWLLEGKSCNEIASEINNKIDSFVKDNKSILKDNINTVIGNLKRDITDTSDQIKNTVKIDLPNPATYLKVIIKHFRLDLELFNVVIAEDKLKGAIKSVKIVATNYINQIGKYDEFIEPLTKDIDNVINYVANLKKEVILLKTQIYDNANYDAYKTQFNQINTLLKDQIKTLHKIKAEAPKAPFIHDIVASLLTTLTKLEEITNKENLKVWEKDFINIKVSAIAVLNEATGLLAEFVSSLSTIKTQIKKIKFEELKKKLSSVVDKAVENTKDKFLNWLKEIFESIDSKLQNESTLLIAEVEKSYVVLNTNLQSTSVTLTGLISSQTKLALDLITTFQTTSLSLAESWIDSLATTMKDQISKLVTSCEQLHESEFVKELEKFRDNVSSRIDNDVGQFFDSIIDQSTQQKLEALAKEFPAKAEKGLKLVKAIGELPALPTITFNATLAEYVFGDLEKSIQTSPFAVKLREVDGAIKELGLAIPSSELLDQFIPSSLEKIKFNDVFKNFGGIDFSQLFDKFKLPSTINSDHIKITHGLDKTNRQAWVKSEVKADFPEKQPLFEFAGLGVSASNMHLRATSDMRVDLQGKQTSVTEAKFISDMSMDFAGNTMATFREVTVSFNGGKFDFDISPDKVELHPSIKFISEIAKKLESSLPPVIEVIKDDHGIPIGAKSCLTTMVTAPPPLGPISLGTLFLQSGLKLMMTREGFVLSSFLSVGSKESPIFLQIGVMGGGIWLVATATQRGSGTDITASLGMAVGSTRSFNAGGIARGSYAVLLFAYATYEVENGQQKALEFRAGLSMQGSARILGMANASVYLLLEVVHSSDGATKGHGLLDVSVDICWCYTLHVRQQVEQNI